MAALTAGYVMMRASNVVHPVAPEAPHGTGVLGEAVHAFPGHAHEVYGASGTDIEHCASISHGRNKTNIGFARIKRTRFSIPSP